MVDGVIKNMSEQERVEYAINKLRVFGASTYIPELSSTCADGDIVVANFDVFRQFIYPHLSTIPNIDTMFFNGYFCDVSQKLYIKNANDAITEIARRLENIYIYSYDLGNKLPKEMLDSQFINTLVETPLNEYKYLRLMPMMVRIKFKDNKSRKILKLTTKSTLLPFVIANDARNMNKQEIVDAIEIFKKDCDDSNKVLESLNA